MLSAHWHASDEAQFAGRAPFCLNCARVAKGSPTVRRTAVTSNVVRSAKYPTAPIAFDGGDGIG